MNCVNRFAWVAGVVTASVSGVQAQEFIGSYDIGESPQTQSFTFDPYVLNPTSSHGVTVDIPDAPSGLNYEYGFKDGKAVLYAGREYGDQFSWNHGPDIDGAMFTLDASTGAATYLGNAPLLNSLTGLAWNPVTQDLWGVSRDGHLYRNMDDPLNAVPVGRFTAPQFDNLFVYSAQIADIAFDSKGNLHMLNTSGIDQGIYVVEAENLDTAGQQLVRGRLLYENPFEREINLIGGLFIDWSRDDEGYMTVGEFQPNGVVIPKIGYFDSLALGGDSVTAGERFPFGGEVLSLTRVPVPAPGSGTVLLGGMALLGRRRRSIAGTKTASAPRTKVVAAAAVAAAVAGGAAAEPISYTWTFDASGIANETAFERSQISLTAYGDTDNVDIEDGGGYGAFCIVRDLSTTIVQIAGVGSYTLDTVAQGGRDATAKFDIPRSQVFFGHVDEIIFGPEDREAFDGWRMDSDLTVSGWGYTGGHTILWDFAGVALASGGYLKLDQGYTWTTFTATLGDEPDSRSVPAPGMAAFAGIFATSTLARRRARA